MGLVRHGDAGDLDAARAWACWVAAGGAHRAVAQSSGRRGLWSGSWVGGKQKRERRGGLR
jgi:hypothetical protein